MAQIFPSLKPSSREFRMGTYPTKVYRALSGATVKRSFGNRPYGYQLDLAFVNITDSVVTQILDHYNTTYGGFRRFPLPDSLFAGMTVDLKARIQSPNSIEWEYVEPPSVTSVYPGISSVSVSFTGEMNV